MSKKILLRTRSIVMFIPISAINNDSFWIRVVQGVETAATLKDFTVSIRTIDENTTKDDVISAIKQVSGAIFISHKTAWLINEVCGSCPTLLMTYPTIPMLQTDCMSMCDCEAMESLCDQIIEWGHKKIAYYGPVERLFGKEILRGIERSTKKHAIERFEIWDDSESDDTYQSVTRILTQKKANGELPTAILCASDSLAHTVVYVLSSLSIPVPQQISVTSFNSNIGLSTSIPVTGMGCDKFDYGHEAFHVLYQRIINPHMPYRRIQFLQQPVKGTTAGPVCK